VVARLRRDENVTGRYLPLRGFVFFVSHLES
jgi:hypothetical protein